MALLSTFSAVSSRPFRNFRIGSGSLTVNYTVIGGGGAGGSGQIGQAFGYGAGGAGGLLEATSVVIDRLATVVVGAGGAAISRNLVGQNGSKTTLYNGYGLNVVALGGGGSVQNGGSGGGANGTTGGLGTAGQGNNGAGASTNVHSGGGGGAGSAGIFANGTGGGGGGAGLACAATDNVVRAGGGGGYWYDGVNFTKGLGGTGGGGDGASDFRSSGGSFTVAQSGSINTGGGGGNDLAFQTPISGGSGIVIIRYTSPTILARGGTITQSGGFVYHTFTTSGTFVIN